MRLSSLIEIKTSSTKRKKKKKRKSTTEKNKELLCRYWSLMYPSDYTSDLVGAKCDG